MWQAEYSNLTMLASIAILALTISGRHSRDGSIDSRSRHCVARRDVFHRNF